jgi:hypothetical protein
MRGKLSVDHSGRGRLQTFLKKQAKRGRTKLGEKETTQEKIHQSCFPPAAKLRRRKLRKKFSLFIHQFLAQLMLNPPRLRAQRN